MSRTPSVPAPAPSPCCPPVPVGELFLASETDRLRACLVHAPGRELERLIPANYRWHLYDDLLHLDRAKSEHALFRELLGRLGVRVDELATELANVYEQMSSFDRRAFLQKVHDVNPGAPSYVLRDLAEVESAAVVARAIIEGVEATSSFAAAVEDAFYYLEPMANLIFMQDVAVVLLDRVIQGYMSQLVRMPEEVVVETVIRLSSVFGPRGTGEFWIDPDFRARHRMHRSVREYMQIDAARMSVRLGEVEARALGPSPDKPFHGRAERVHIELEGAFMADGRHFILEGGNVLALRRPDGKTVVLIGHNARTSADAIDELAYRLLRHDGRKLRGEIGAVIVVDIAHQRDEATHLDTHLLALTDDELFLDRTLVQPAAGPGARFYVFLPDRHAPPPPSDEFRPVLKVELVPCRDLDEALGRAGLRLRVRWIPGRVPWEPESTLRGEAWVRLQQTLWANALNVLTVAPGVFVGLDRHAAFYESEIGAVCVDAEKEVTSGELSSLRCCALLAALRERAQGKPVALLIPGDELSRARGGPRSLVLPLVREREP
jgi:arginine deiminase